MAFLGFNTENITRASHMVQVPENNIAKLMYYLDVVCTLVEYNDPAMNKLRNFTKHYTLSTNERVFLYVLCSKLDPDDLVDSVIFKDESGVLCGGSLNRIYDINQVQHRFVVSNSIVIGGQRRKVKKFMVIRPEWLRKFYFVPMLSITAEIEEERRKQAIADLIDTCTIS